MDESVCARSYHDTIHATTGAGPPSRIRFLEINYHNMAASGEDISVCFKVSTGKKFDLKLSPTLTVLETKQKAEAESDVPAAQQRLIYRGMSAKRRSLF